MRIVSVAARTVRWAIPGGGAARGRSERAAVLLEVRSDRGAIGLGEAAPLPGMSLDTLDDAGRAIDGLAARVPCDVPDRDAAFARADAAVLADLAPGRGDRDLAGATGLSAPAARFAIATALLDAMAREHSVSLAGLLAPTSAPIGGASATQAGARAIPLAAVVDGPDDARRGLAAGVRCFKIKVGESGDVERVRAIAAAAPGATLRLDANRSWPRSEVDAHLAALADLSIDYVEEPCLDAHLLLSMPLPCRIALDESIATLSPDELDAALASPRLAALVLKPTLLGGLSAALALAARARRAGVAAIASHTLEGPIGTAACAELALALGGEHAVGLARHAALAGWRLHVTQLADDHVRPAVAPGLGFAGLDLDGAVRACIATSGGAPAQREGSDAGGPTDSRSDRGTEAPARREGSDAGGPTDSRSDRGTDR